MHGKTSRFIIFLSIIRFFYFLNIFVHLCFPEASLNINKMVLRGYNQAVVVKSEIVEEMI